MEFKRIKKLKKGDKVAIVSPSFAAPGMWSDVYEMSLSRMRAIFELEPIEFPATKKIGASASERSSDLIAAFEDPDIKAVMASLGGDDQVTYIKNLPIEPFTNNPKLFFGYSDNTHFINHLWLNGIPAFYGASLFTEFGIQGEMDKFTIEFLKTAFFEEGELDLSASDVFNDIGLDWSDPSTLTQKRRYQPNEGWHWDGNNSSEGILWGGCLESIDELLRHDIRLPSLSDFSGIIMAVETSEEIPSSNYVMRVFRALGERKILESIQGLVVGRPKAWEFNNPQSDERKVKYKTEQRQTILEIVRRYNPKIPIVQNMDFGHTAPQISLPFGKKMRIDVTKKKVSAYF